MDTLKTTVQTQRVLQLCIFCLFQLVLVWFAFSAIQANVVCKVLPVILLCELFLVGFTYFLLRLVPVIELTKEGLYERILIKKRFYSWDSIKQAGVLKTFFRYGYVKDFVLLKPNGSPRRYKDKTFPLRNMGKLIHLPSSDVFRDYVVKYYGPLDFNIWDNPKEESTVVN